MTVSAKDTVLRAMESPWFVRALRRFRAPACATVLMHRFVTPHRYIGRHDPQKLKQVLSTLRAAGVALIPLEEAVGYCEASRPKLNRLAVSFTVDDGYADFADVAWPVFREFECPVSLFVVPDVVSGSTWFWWDKLDWLMSHSPAQYVDLEVAEKRYVARWDSSASRIAAQEGLTEFCKQLPTETVEQQIHALSVQWGLVIPERAPDEYRALSWGELRDLERQGVRIGPHTMTHPVLGRCTEQRAAAEIVRSVQALKEQLAAPLPVFCYPNGTADDHGPREWSLVESTGTPYAITTTRGLMKPSLSEAGIERWRYRLPRVGYADRAGYIIREFLL